MTGRKVGKIALWGIVILVVLMATALWVGSKYLTTYVNENTETWMGRKATVDDIDINIFSGALKLDNIQVYEANKNDTFLSLHKLTVNLNLPAIYEGNYLIDNLVIDSLNLRIQQQDGVFNFQDILEHFASDDSLSVNADSSESTQSLQYGLRNFSIHRSNIHYLDNSLPLPVHLRDIEFSLPSGFYSHEHDLEGHLSFELNKAGKLTTDLNYNLGNDDFDGHLKIDDLNLALAQPFLQDFIFISSLEGKASSNLYMHGLLKDPANMDVSGMLAVNDFAYTDHRNEKVAAFQSLEIQIDSLNALKNQYSISKVAVTKPGGVFHLYKDSNNFTTLTKPEPKVADSSETLVALRQIVEEPSNIFATLAEQVRTTVSSYKASNLRVDTVRVLAGYFTYHDHTLLKPFQYSIDDLSITSNEFYFNRDSVLLNLRTRLNRAGLLSASTVLHPKKMEDLDVEVVIDSMNLTAISPYFYEYLGHEIDSGILDFTTSIVIRDSVLSSANHVIINGMDLSKKERHELAAKLPTKTAISALKDRKGVIDLNIPIEGNLSDPNYKIGKVVTKVLKNIIIKAAASPVNVVGRALSRKDKGEKKSKE